MLKTSISANFVNALSEQLTEIQGLPIQLLGLGKAKKLIDGARQLRGFVNESFQLVSTAAAAPRLPTNEHNPLMSQETSELIRNAATSPPKAKPSLSRTCFCSATNSVKIAIRQTTPEIHLSRTDRDMLMPSVLC